MEELNCALEVLGSMSPITLEQMKGIKLMDRTDTKFVLSETSLIHLLKEAAAQGYMAQAPQGGPCGQSADYRTLYYDTPLRDMYMIHHNKRMRRQKIRTREYLDTGDTFIEVKNKDNHGRTKKVRERISSAIFTSVIENPSASAFLEKLSLYPVADLSPALETIFSRITLVNPGRTERVTLDTSLHFRNLRNGASASLPGIVVMELKRDGRVHSPMLEILLKLRIKPLKFSKYCMGTAITDPFIKQNRFKARLKMVNKIKCI